MNTDSARKEKVTKMYAAAITLMLFGSAVGLMMYHDTTNQLKASIDNEKIMNESLLSEKLSLSKEVANMIDELESLSAQNTTLTKKWQNAVALIGDRDKKINGMSSENKKAKQLIAEVETLRSVKAQVNGELDRVKSELAAIKSENDRMTSEIAGLKSSNDELASTIAMLNQVTVNNSLVEATKGRKDHLTVNAHKTKKLKVGFDLPSEMIGDLYFKMMTPDGKVVSSEESTISFYTTDAAGEMVASLDNVMPKAGDKKHITMSYQPETKLESGIYKIDVYSSEKYLGTTRIHLK